MLLLLVSQIRRDVPTRFTDTFEQLQAQVFVFLCPTSGRQAKFAHQRGPVLTGTVCSNELQEVHNRNTPVQALAFGAFVQSLLKLCRSHAFAVQNVYDLIPNIFEHYASPHSLLYFFSG